MTDFNCTCGAKVSEHPAATCLDAVIAEKVMGQPWMGGNPVPNYDGRWPWPPPYSSNIEAAMEVLCKARKGNERFQLWSLTGTPGYFCHIGDNRCLSSHGETICLAIVRAALGVPKVT